MKNIELLIYMQNWTDLKDTVCIQFSKWQNYSHGKLVSGGQGWG